ncbi:serpin family protein [Nocardia brasiliensis]|uniref:serpin family protein n=1 Tax=Nocardia brasiliensis TaxID=37326 RepID=UPI003D9029FC
MPKHVGAANALTARWCRAASDADFVLSGAGVWPLLALLAPAANEPARSELAAAVGLSSAEAHAAGLLILDELAGAEAIRAALGIWVREDLPLHEEWVRTLPAGVVEHLSDREALDAWAEQHTGGLIERFPLTRTPSTLAVLATAIVAKTSWRKPFRADVLTPADGPWRGLRIPALHRTGSDIGAAALLSGAEPVTRIVVEGETDLDMHLLLGPGSPGTVLETGLAAIAGTVPIRTDLPVGTVGPGLDVHTEMLTSTTDLLRITLPPFDLRTKHDLLEQAEVLGLIGAADPARSRFPAMSDGPLYISAAVQDVLARFDAEGFEAAAVTAIAMTRSLPPAPHETTVITATFDRPFGFLAVHRPTGLAVAAGWVATPTSEGGTLG